jgi:protein-disulfide isomerase
MRRFALASSLIVAIAAVAFSVFAADFGSMASGSATVLPDRILGKADAPITVEEYVSLTCSHCAEFYNKILPELEPKYVDTGKVRFILRDYPLDGTALKAAAVARCMPEEEFYPFVKTLYSNLAQWATATNPEQVLIQFAKLGGLTEDKAKACLQDKSMQDAIIAERMTASSKFNIEATPTFIINYGAEKLDGAREASEFSAVFDRLLAAKK